MLKQREEIQEEQRPFKDWFEFFEWNRDNQTSIDWSNEDQMSSKEKELLSASLQDFQVGEYSEGKNFQKKAHIFSALFDIPWYSRSIELFIKEEQRHSHYLLDFMEIQSIEPKKEVWLDFIFTKLRSLGNLEAKVMVLLTAEIFSMVFYKALREASNSVLLKQICQQILKDEVKHLQFQSLALQCLYSKRSNFQNTLHRFVDKIIFRSTQAVVWMKYRKVFQAGGVYFKNYLKYSNKWHSKCEEIILAKDKPIINPINSCKNASSLKQEIRA